MATVKTKARTEYKNGSTNVASNGISKSSCVVAQGTNIEGTFRATENIRLDGSIEGDLECQAKVVVGQKGLVKGNLRAKDAVVMGTVKGDIEVQALLQLEKSAVIEGNIQTAKLIVEEGARYDGTCKVGG